MSELIRQKKQIRMSRKKIFIELIEIMADTIYVINNCADKYESKYGTTYYQQTKKYKEPELECCSNLKHCLENDCDGAFTNSQVANAIVSFI